MKYKHKPTIVDAQRLNNSITIDTLEGEAYGDVGDYMITGSKGEKYICQGSIFNELYEPIEPCNCKNEEKSEEINCQ